MQNITKENKKKYLGVFFSSFQPVSGDWGFCSFSLLPSYFSTLSIFFVQISVAFAFRRIWKCAVEREYRQCYFTTHVQWERERERETLASIFDWYLMNLMRYRDWEWELQGHSQERETVTERQCRRTDKRGKCRLCVRVFNDQVLYFINHFSVEEHCI